MIVRGSKMSKDKSINEINMGYTLAAGIASADFSINPQGVSGVGAVSRPLTVSGLRWQGGSFGGAVTTNHRLKWCIWIRRKGQAIPSQALNAATISDAWGSIDENNILVWGATVIADSVEVYPFEGATKTQRKMQVGDQLMFSYAVSGLTTETGGIFLLLQTFYKS